MEFDFTLEPNENLVNLAIMVKSTPARVKALLEAELAQCGLRYEESLCGTKLKDLHPDHEVSLRDVSIMAFSRSNVAITRELGELTLKGHYDCPECGSHTHTDEDGPWVTEKCANPNCDYNDIYQREPRPSFYL